MHDIKISSAIDARTSSAGNPRALSVVPRVMQTRGRLGKHPEDEMCAEMGCFPVGDNERDLLKRELETLSEARQILCRAQLENAYCAPAADTLYNASKSLRARQDEIFNHLTRD